MTEQNQDPTSLGRRAAIKKAAAAGATAGLVWSAPKIKGLSLRPAYAAAQSGDVCDCTFISYQASPNFFNIQIQNRNNVPCTFEFVICDASFTLADLANVQGNGATTFAFSEDAAGCIVFSGTIPAFGQVQVTQNNGFGGGGGDPFMAGNGFFCGDPV